MRLPWRRKPALPLEILLRPYRIRRLIPDTYRPQDWQ